jgi:bifunctional non-homologous end joining protein LigD
MAPGSAGRLPAPVQPMLATSGPLPPPPGGDTDWAYEFKWDGARTIAYLGGGRLALRSRTGADVTARYPELSGLSRAASVPLVLDGEIVAFDPDEGRPSFALLQRRMHVAVPGAALPASVPVTYLVFDLLHVGGQRLLLRPYAERRARLERLRLAGAAWQTPPAWVGGGPDVLAASRDHGLEGVLAKRLASAYQPGRRSRDWVKVKNVRTLHALVGGWTAGRGYRAGSIGALLLGLPEPPGGLRYIGHVGSGFTVAALDDLARRLAPLARADPPFTAGLTRQAAHGAHWVEAALVGAVDYREWTVDGTLRHPVWRGLR